MINALMRLGRPFPPLPVFEANTPDCKPASRGRDYCADDGQQSKLCFAVLISATLRSAFKFLLCESAAFVSVFPV